MQKGSVGLVNSQYVVAPFKKGGVKATFEQRLTILHEVLLVKDGKGVSEIKYTELLDDVAAVMMGRFPYKKAGALRVGGDLIGGTDHKTSRGLRLLHGCNEPGHKFFGENFVNVAEALERTGEALTIMANNLSEKAGAALVQAMVNAACAGATVPVSESEVEEESEVQVEQEAEA